MKEQIKDWMNYGIVSSLGVALSEQQKKKTGRGVITAYASYYATMAEQAVNGTKKEREAAVMFLIEQLHNNAAMLYNNGIDIEEYRKTVDTLKEKWEK